MGDEGIPYPVFERVRAALRRLMQSNVVRNNPTPPMSESEAAIMEGHAALFEADSKVPPPDGVDRWNGR